MLKIRLQRVGRTHEPAFRLVLTEATNATKSGRFIEILGNHDFRFEKNTKIDKDRVLYWIKNGAQPSDTAHNLLITHGVITGKKRNVLPKKTVEKKPEEASSTSSEQAAPAETPVAEAAPAPEVVVEAPAETTATPAAEVAPEPAPEETPAQ